MAEKIALLPPSSTPVERKLAQVGADLENVPLPLRQLRRAATTPAELLPWLAWERSVERWDDAWTEAAKRKAITSSFLIHRLKGTIGALRRVVEPLGYLLGVTEWWQMVPEGRRGTFRLTLGVLNAGISEPMYHQLERLIEDTKRLSQHMTGLTIVAEVRGGLRVGVTTYCGDVLTVYPYAPGDIEVRVRTPIALGIHHTIDTMTVYP